MLVLCLKKIMINFHSKNKFSNLSSCRQSDQRILWIPWKVYPKRYCLIEELILIFAFFGGEKQHSYSMLQYRRGITITS